MNKLSYVVILIPILLFFFPTVRDMVFQMFISDAEGIETTGVVETIQEMMPTIISIGLIGIILAVLKGVIEGGDYDDEYDEEYEPTLDEVHETLVGRFAHQDSWECAYCGEINNWDERRCFICGSPRTKSLRGSIE